MTSMFSPFDFISPGGTYKNRYKKNGITVTKPFVERVYTVVKNCARQKHSKV